MGASRPIHRALTTVKPLTKERILASDPVLLSAEEKRIYVELLYGPSPEDHWKKELKSVAADLKRWNAFLGSAASMDSPFKVGYTDVVRRAHRVPPENVEATVASLTDWIYRLYVEKPEIEKLRLLQRLERQVVAKRIPVPAHSRWKCIHNGTDEGNGKVLPISVLRVRGEAMRGKPDLVFREKESGCLLIVEIKISDAYVPSDGWPNLRAQLWAYSKIDHDYWRDAPEIFLAGEIWARSVRLRRTRTLYWKAPDPTLDSQCMELFEIFKNHVEAQ